METFNRAGNTNGGKGETVSEQRSLKAGKPKNRKTVRWSDGNIVIIADGVPAEHFARRRNANQRKG
jgi:hypothetical protein